MAGFRFRLARAYEWYDRKRRLEEDCLREKRAALSQCRAALAQAAEGRRAAERELMESPVLRAAELVALARYRHRAIQQEQKLAQNCVRCEREIEVQLGIVQAARQRVRLIEKLRERRLAEYTAAMEQELEELAADAFRAVHSRAE